MIIKDINNKEVVLFEPETIKERSFLEKFPGLLREGLNFYAPGKARIVQNLFHRLSKKVSAEKIKYTPNVQSMVLEGQKHIPFPEDFYFYTKPLPHQSLALRFMWEQGSCGLLLDPGLGKTKVVLDYIFMMKFKKVIIVCPKPLLYVWEAEILKHRPELSFYVIKSTDWASEAKGVEGAQVVILNYDKAVALETNLQTIKASFIALDEALIKDYTTIRTKSLTKLRASVPYRCVMSGTLVNNTPLDCFSPIRFIEPSLLGEGVTRFKDRYAVTSKYNQNIILGFMDMEEIQTIISACSIVMRKEEWLSYLPKKRFHNIYTKLNGDALDCYNNLVSNWMFEYDGTTYTYDNPLPRMGKLLQIANGFSYVVEEDPLEEMEEEVKKPKKSAKDRKVSFFNSNPKVDALKALIDDRARLSNRRAIIWFNFQAELTLLEQSLSKWGIKYLVVKGGEKNIGEKINTFNTDPSYRFLVAQSRTINYGATILGVKDKEDVDVVPEFSTTISDQIFMSLGFSLEMFLQQQDRIHRIGQEMECNYWLILTDSCIEKAVEEAMTNKIRMSRRLLVDISKSVVNLT